MGTADSKTTWVISSVSHFSILGGKATHGFYPAQFITLKGGADFPHSVIICMIVTESQNGWSLKKALKIIWSNPLALEALSRAGCPELHPNTFLISPILLNLPEKASPMLSQSQSKTAD